MRGVCGGGREEDGEVEADIVIDVDRERGMGGKRLSLPCTVMHEEGREQGVIPKAVKDQTKDKCRS